MDAHDPLDPSQQTGAIGRTVGCEDSAVVTCCAHHGHDGIITVFVVVVPAKTLVS